jgi:hypothetical protein
MRKTKEYYYYYYFTRSCCLEHCSLLKKKNLFEEEEDFSPAPISPYRHFFVPRTNEIVIDERESNPQSSPSSVT